MVYEEVLIKQGALCVKSVNNTGSEIYKYTFFHKWINKLFSDENINKAKQFVIVY